MIFFSFLTSLIPLKCMISWTELFWGRII